jgi:quercetin dioxygenase-like cupin family protein
MSLDVAPVPRSEWSPLRFEGCVGVVGKVLVREEDFFIAMLRFSQHATIHEHPGENDTLVVCIEGEGFTSVGGETAPLHESERAFWPTSVPHRLWTEDGSMTTLMVERRGVGFPARGLGDFSG